MSVPTTRKIDAANKGSQVADMALRLAKRERRIAAMEKGESGSRFIALLVVDTGRWRIGSLESGHQ